MSIQPGDDAAYRYCRTPRIVKVLSEIEGSAGIARDPMFRIDMDGKQIIARESELKSVDRPETADERQPLIVEQVWGTP